MRGTGSRILKHTITMKTYVKPVWREFASIFPKASQPKHETTMNGEPLIMNFHINKDKDMKRIRLLIF